jgi:hypothetical protein
MSSGTEFYPAGAAAKHIRARTRAKSTFDSYIVRNL